MMSSGTPAISGVAVRLSAATCQSEGSGLAKTNRPTKSVTTSTVNKNGKRWRRKSGASRFSQKPAYHKMTTYQANGKATTGPQPARHQKFKLGPKPALVKSKPKI